MRANSSTKLIKMYVIRPGKACKIFIKLGVLAIVASYY